MFGRLLSGSQLGCYCPGSGEIWEFFMPDLSGWWPWTTVQWSTYIHGKADVTCGLTEYRAWSCTYATGSNHR